MWAAGPLCVVWLSVNVAGRLRVLSAVSVCASGQGADGRPQSRKVDGQPEQRAKNVHSAPGQRATACRVARDQGGLAQQTV